MFQKDSYQIFDRSPISAVTIKVKQSHVCSNDNIFLRDVLIYNCSNSLYDVNDFIVPAVENSGVSIVTQMVKIKHVLKPCKDKHLEMYYRYSPLRNVSVHQCDHSSRCILPPAFRNQEKDLLNQEILCWFESVPKEPRLNYQALDYIIFIKHFVEFAQLGVVRQNLLSEVLTPDYLKTCEFDPSEHPLCPKFRILKILQIVEKDPREYKSIFFYGCLIEIRISWKCNLDRNLKYCEPTYEFKRLDVIPYNANPYEPGSNFLTSSYYFQPNSSELYRIHTRIYNLHIFVSISGEAGRFDLFQTTTSIGSFLGIFGTGAIVCDLIGGFIVNFKSVKYDN